MTDTLKKIFFLYMSEEWTREQNMEMENTIKRLVKLSSGPNKKYRSCHVAPALATLGPVQGGGT